MKVVITADSFPPHYSGVTTYCLELSRWLIKLGHQVLIFAPKPKTPQKPPLGLEKVKIVYLPSIPIKQGTFRLCLPNPTKVLLELRKFKPDVVNTQGPSFLGIDALLAAKIVSVPVVSTFHTLFTSPEYLQLIVRTKHTRLLQRASWNYHRWFLGASDKVYVATPKLQKLLTTHGITKTKIEITPMLIDLKHISILDQPKAKDIKKHYDLNNKVAVSIGRISLEKNLELVINSWKIVTKKVDDCTLLIGGDGPAKKHLESLVHRLHLHNVTFIGSYNNRQFLESGLLSACNVYVSGSTSETFGLTTIEAMASKLPTILIKSQGVCEIVEDSGLVLSRKDPKLLANAIINLFSHPDLAKSMGQKAQQIASRFDSETGVKILVKQYQQVIDTYQASSPSLIKKLRTQLKSYTKRLKNLLEIYT